MDSHRHARQASRQKLPIIPRTFDRRPLAQILCIDHQQGRRATMEDTEVVLLENDFHSASSMGMAAVMFHKP